MIKTTTFALVDDSTEQVYVKRLDASQSFEKSASEVLSVLHPELVSFLKTLKPKPGKSYLLTNAMGASDYFGSNLNADWFSEKVLQDYHKTFEVYGHQFRHHVNKDPKIAEGKVIFSFYNKDMHRVELIVEVDNDKVKDVLDRLDKKETVATSMACKVTYDICSICGNKAKSREDYCIHLKAFKNKLHTPTSPIPGAKYYGQKAFAINPDPKFFDISFVTIPADSTSSVLLKVAEAFGKSSDIVKEVKGESKVINSDLIRQCHGNIPRKDIDALIEKYSSTEIMTHLINMNMIPSFNDYAYMRMKEDGIKEAEVLYDNDITIDFDTVQPDKLEMIKASHVMYNDRLANELTKYGSEIGIGEPLVLTRVLEKQAKDDHVVNTIPYFGGVGAAYYGYNMLLDKLQKSKPTQLLAETKIPPAIKSKGATMLMKNPMIFGAGLLGAGYLTNEAQRLLNEKSKLVKESAAPAAYARAIEQHPGIGRFLTTVGIVSPLTFMYSSVNRKKILEGKEVTTAGSFAANHPVLANLAAVAGTYYPQKAYGKLKSHAGKFGKASSVDDYFSYMYVCEPEEFKKVFDEHLTIDK